MGHVHVVGEVEEQEASPHREEWAEDRLPDEEPIHDGSCAGGHLID